MKNLYHLGIQKNTRFLFKEACEVESSTPEISAETALDLLGLNLDQEVTPPLKRKERIWKKLKVATLGTVKMLGKEIDKDWDRWNKMDRVLDLDIRGDSEADINGYNERVKLAKWLIEAAKKFANEDDNKTLEQLVEELAIKKGMQNERKECAPTPVAPEVVEKMGVSFFPPQYERLHSTEKRDEKQILLGKDQKSIGKAFFLALNGGSDYGDDWEKMLEKAKSDRDGALEKLKSVLPDTLYVVSSLDIGAGGRLTIRNEKGKALDAEHKWQFDGGEYSPKLSLIKRPNGDPDVVIGKNGNAMVRVKGIAMSRKTGEEKEITGYVSIFYLDTKKSD